MPPRPGGAADRAPLPEGHELDGGRYRLGAPIGQGGFGITYAAVDQRLRRPVAIKELFPQRARRSGTTVVVPGDAAPAFARARDRFLREARTLGRFGHPNIVRIFGVLEAHGTAYIVLERLEGATLAAELRRRRGPFSEAEAVDVAVQAGAALAVVHRAGVLHRDVSPANLVRTPDGRIVLIDFGLARPYEDDRTTSMTRIVTPGYAPPEQHRGMARFSPRADVYALGATLHRLLSGRTPPTPAARAAGRELPSLWQVNPTVSRSVSDAVDAALALDPADRPAGIADLLSRLGVDPATVDLGPAPEDALVASEAASEPGPPGVPPVDLSDEDVEDLLATEVVTAVRVDEGRWVDASEVAPRPARRRIAAVSPVELDGPTEVARPEPRPLPTPEPPQVAPPEPDPAPASPWPDPEPARSWAVPAPAEPPRPADLPPARRAAVPPARPATPAHAADHHVAAPAVGGWGPPGRAWVAVPLGLATVAITSAQPVTLTALLALVASPVLATVGDRVLRRRRSPAVLVGWLLRNLVVAVGRALGPALVLAAGLLLWWGADSVGSLRGAAPWVLRATGIATGWILATQIGRGSRRARSNVAVDALAVRLLPAGRPTLPAAVLVIACTGVTAAGLWFTPEAWPLG